MVKGDHMTKKYIFGCFLLLMTNLCADLKEEFNISNYWHEGMTWDEFLKVRNNLRRKGLIKYVDKIAQQKLAAIAGLKVPRTYIATNESVPIIDLISPLSSYVVKATHMSLSQGLMIVKNGVNMLTGKPITPKQVQEQIFASLKNRPRKVESWALHHVQPGFMIQEYIPNRMEVKIQTIWGRAVIGEWRGGEPKWAQTAIWGRYDRDGNIKNGSSPAPSWWPKAVAAAEKMAKDTDALRVDFLVREDGQLLLNELEIWPESNWSSMTSTLESQLNAGYRALKTGRPK